MRRREQSDRLERRRDCLEERRLALEHGLLCTPPLSFVGLVGWAGLGCNEEASRAGAIARPSPGQVGHLYRTPPCRAVRLSPSPQPSSSRAYPTTPGAHGKSCDAKHSTTMEKRACSASLIERVPPQLGTTACRPVPQKAQLVLPA
jgi:hypothetical protein